MRVDGQAYLSTRRQRGRETFEIAVIRRQTKAQQIVSPLEMPAPDVLDRERGVRVGGVGAAREPEQSGSADNRESGVGQYGIELARAV
jgi:hypothetical protein